MTSKNFKMYSSGLELEKNEPEDQRTLRVKNKITCPSYCSLVQTESWKKGEKWRIVKVAVLTGLFFRTEIFQISKGSSGYYYEAHGKMSENSSFCTYGMKTVTKQLIKILGLYFYLILQKHKISTMSTRAWGYFLLCVCKGLKKCYYLWEQVPFFEIHQY